MHQGGTKHVIYGCVVAACRNTRADIAFMLDASGSIIAGPNSTLNYTNWNLMKEFVITLIHSLSVSTNQMRIALVRFSDEVDVIFHLNNYSTGQEAIEVTFALLYIFLSFIFPESSENWQDRCSD